MSSRSTYKLDADTQIHVGGAALCSIVVYTDGTNDATLILSDVADSGDVADANQIIKWIVTGSSNQDGRNWFEPVQVKNGIYANIAGTGAAYTVEYRKA